MSWIFADVAGVLAHVFGDGVLCSAFVAEKKVVVC